MPFSQELTRYKSQEHSNWANLGVYLFADRLRTIVPAPLLSEIGCMRGCCILLKGPICIWEHLTSPWHEATQILSLLISLLIFPPFRTNINVNFPSEDTTAQTITEAGFLVPITLFRLGGITLRYFYYNLSF